MDRRRIPGTGSKQEVRPGVWRLYEPGGIDPTSGKRYRPSHTFYGSEAEAELALQALCARAGRQSGTAMTLWEFIETMYLPAVEPPELRRRTVDEYRRKLEKYVKGSRLAGIRMDALTRFALVSWMRDVKSQVSNKQTQLHVYRVLSAALGRAVEWGALDENVLTVAVKPPTPDEYLPVALTEDEANDYLDAFVGHALEPTVVLQIATGLRPSEVLAVEWTDIDMTTGEVTITKGLHQREGKVWTEGTKSRKSTRVVVLPDWAIDSLKSHRGIGRLSGSLTPEQVRWRYKRHVEASHLPWCPMENLRHTYATIAVERGISSDEVADSMGHTSTKMVSERYVKRRIMRAKRVASVMEDVRRKPSRARRDAK